MFLNLIQFGEKLQTTFFWLTICLTAPFPGLPGWAGKRKVNPIWILLKQEIVSGSGISWAICKSAHRSRQITTPAPHHSVFYRPDALPAAQPTASKHWRPTMYKHNYHQWRIKSIQLIIYARRRTVGAGCWRWPWLGQSLQRPPIHCRPVWPTASTAHP